MSDGDSGVKDDQVELRGQEVARVVGGCLIEGGLGNLIRSERFEGTTFQIRGSTRGKAWKMCLWKIREAM